MKRIRINVGMVAITSKNKEVKRILSHGNQWIHYGENFLLLDITKLHTCNDDYEIMLQNESFNSNCNVINISDSEIALKYVNGNFESILKPGKYFHWNNTVNFKIIKVDLQSTYIDGSINKALFQNPLLAQYIREFKVESYEDALLVIDGKFVKHLSKGSYYFWKNIIPIEVLRVDIRQLLMEISGQEILTLDKAALRINFMAQYRIINSEKALLDNNNFSKQLYSIFQLVLRDYIGKLTLDELLSRKESISNFIRQIVEKQAINLGVEIIDVGIKDIILPGEVKTILSQIMIAEKKAIANTITRREETAATRSLLNTARLMENNAMLYKLKEMEYIEKIADRVGEVTLSGNGHIVDQLTGIFTTNKIKFETDETSNFNRS